MGQIKTLVSLLALTSCVAIQPTPRPTAPVGPSPRIQPSASLNPASPRPSANAGQLPPIPGVSAPLPSSSVRPLPSQAPTIEPSPAFSSYPIEVVAGSGEQGFKDGPALMASFNAPGKPCSDPRDGSLYIPDTHMLRKLTPEGQVITVAGGQASGYRDGVAAEARFDSLISCVVDSQSAVLLADRKNRRIRKFTPDGQVTTFLGTGAEEVQDGDRTQAAFSENVTDMVADSYGDLFITDGHFIRIFRQQRLSTLNASQETGAFSNGYSDGSIATVGLLGSVLWIAVDKERNIFFADSQVGRLRKLDALNVLSSISILPEDAPPIYGIDDWRHSFNRPRGITFDAFHNKLFVLADSHVFESDLEGHLNLIASNFLFRQREQEEKQYFNSLQDGAIILGKDQNLYIVDEASLQIKRILLHS